jgi:hypothetical protein
MAVISYHLGAGHARFCRIRVYHLEIQLMLVAGRFPTTPESPLTRLTNHTLLRRLLRHYNNDRHANECNPKYGGDDGTLGFLLPV